MYLARYPVFCWLSGIQLAGYPVSGKYWPGLYSLSVQDPEALYKVEMTEAPDKPPEPFPGQYQTEKPAENTNNHNNPGQHTPVIRIRINISVADPEKNGSGSLKSKRLTEIIRKSYLFVREDFFFFFKKV